MELIAEFFWPTVGVALWVAYCVACLNHAPKSYRDERE